MTTTATKTVKGVLGEKLGMTQVWDADNRLVPVTVIKAGPCVVTQVRKADNDGYDAVQIAFGAIDPRKVNKPMGGHFEKAGVTPRRHLVELRTADAAEYALGQEITAESFEAGQEIDITGTTKGKGFAGVMKRHGFHGVGASHGAHRNHRKPGSIGGCVDPGSRLQGHAHGRPDGWRAPDHPEPHHPRRGRREGSAARQGCRPRPPWRHRPGSHGCQGSLSHMPTAEKNLPAEIFDVQVNVPLIHQVVVAQLAAARQGTHSTKTRGEVRGGGRKPYRQKGTGRARQGSTRAPQFAGGGVVHGPQPRDYAQRTPKKMKAAALRGALSDRARHGRIHVIDSLVSGDAPSAKDAGKLLAGLTERKNLLVVLTRDDEVAFKSVRNLADVHVLVADQLNTYDVLCADDIVFTQAALDAFVAGPAKAEKEEAK